MAKWAALKVGSDGWVAFNGDSRSEGQMRSRDAFDISQTPHAHRFKHTFDSSAAYYEELWH